MELPPSSSSTSPHTQLQQLQQSQQRIASANVNNPKGARRTWSLPRRLMSFGFTGLSRTTSNIESRYIPSVTPEGDVKYVRLVTGLLLY